MEKEKKTKTPTMDVPRESRWKGRRAYWGVLVGVHLISIVQWLAYAAGYGCFFSGIWKAFSVGGVVLWGVLPIIRPSLIPAPLPVEGDKNEALNTLRYRLICMMLSTLVCSLGILAFLGNCRPLSSFGGR